MLLQNRYEYNPQTDFIADGSAARVYLAFDNATDKPVIVKFYHALSVEHQTFKHNMERIQQLQHPNLVQLYDYFVMETINYIGQITEVKVGIWEYVPSTLVDLPLSSEQTELALRHILSGLQFLYDNGCSHLDLDYDNVLLLQDGTVKLNNYEITNTNPDTPPAVEQDLAGMGKVLHQFCTGELPNPNNPDALQNNKTREVYSVIINQCLNGEINSVEQALTTLNEYERNKRFSEVLPLQTKQTQTRYAFELNEDLLQDTSHSYVVNAFDNLLDINVSLEIFKNDPTVALLQSLDQSKYTYLFKMELPGDESDTYKTALAGVIAPAPAVQPEAESEIFALMEESSILPQAGDTATLNPLPIAEIEEAADLAPILNEPEPIDNPLQPEAADNEEQPEPEITDELTAEEQQEPIADEQEAPTTNPETEPETNADNNDNGIIVVQIKDHIDGSTPAPASQEDADNMPEDTEPPLTPNNDITIEFVNHQLTPEGDSSEDYVNTEVILKSAIEQVNADMNKDAQAMEDIAIEITDNLADSFATTDTAADNTETSTPTGLIKIEALSQLSEDLENAADTTSKKIEEEKDKYLNIAIDTLKDNTTTDAPASSDTEIIEKEAMEQVMKDLERLLSGDDEG